jgi:hypothetical protein
MSASGQATKATECPGWARCYRGQAALNVRFRDDQIGVAFSSLAGVAGRSGGTSMLTFPVSRQSGFSIRDKT